MFQEFVKAMFAIWSGLGEWETKSKTQLWTLKSIPTVTELGLLVKLMETTLADPEVIEADLDELKHLKLALQAATRYILAAETFRESYKSIVQYFSKVCSRDL